MPANPETHPTRDQLTAFAQGKLPDAELAAVATHLEGCPPCRRLAANAPVDSFLGRVQEARPRGTGTRLAGEVSQANSQPGQPTPAPEPPLLDLPPELANHAKFRIVKELGRGGMGVVYLAEHKLMESLVALKVISRAVLDHPDALARFHAEVKAAAKLVHPHIVRALDADQAGDLHLLVMEYVEGMDLARVVEKKGPLPVAHACHYIRQAALGLQHAFEQGMAHRDIKPHNLILNPKGQVKILDFGLARVRDKSGKGRPQLTKLDSFMGTPDYVAPEQAVDARQADTRADIYSLGCTLYHLLAGRPPFEEDTPAKVILAHLEKEPVPLRERRPDVSPELSAVVSRMLAKDPLRRYQQPIEVAQTLALFAKTSGKMAPADSVARPVKPSATQRTIPPEEATSAFEGLKVPRSETTKAKPRGSSKSDRPDRRLWIGGSAAGLLLLVALAFAVVSLGGLSRSNPTPTVVEQALQPPVAPTQQAALAASADVDKPPPSPPIPIKGVLELRVSPLGAEVLVDGKRVESAAAGPTQLELPLGKHEVRVTKEGFEPVRREVTLVAGRNEIHQFNLVSKQGTLELRVTPPEAELFVDRKWVGSASAGPTRLELPPGRHEVQVKKGGFQEVTREVTLPAGQTEIVHVALRPDAEKPPATETAQSPKTDPLTNSLGMRFVRVPKGTFWMGGGGGKSGNKEVEIKEDFWIGANEVTQEQWEKVMGGGKNPSYFNRSRVSKDEVSDGELLQFPVDSVSWKEIQEEFLPKLNKLEEGSGWWYRLPTEQEWEYACRGGARPKVECAFDFYFWDAAAKKEILTNALSSRQANFNGNYPAGNARKGKYWIRPIKVGSYQPNRLGIYDMAGNVVEWTATEEGSGRVIRGGGWYCSGQFCRAAFRSRDAPSDRSHDLGFRLARVPSRK